MLRILNYGNASHRQQTLCFIYFFANWIFPLEAHDETSLGILRVKPEVFHFRFSSSFYLHYPTEVLLSAIDSRRKNAERTRFGSGGWGEAVEKKGDSTRTTEIEYLSMTVTELRLDFKRVRLGAQQKTVRNQTAKTQTENFPESS